MYVSLRFTYSQLFIESLTRGVRNDHYFWLFVSVCKTFPVSSI